MADPNTIALVSVIVTGSTAVLAPAVAAWREGSRERRRFAHERTMNDLAELRVLLDETAARLGDVIDTLDVHSGITAEQRFSLLLEHRRTLLRDLGRIAIRLGSDDVALLAAEGATASVERLVHLLDPTNEATGVKDDIVATYEDFDRARESFYDAAQLVVGARVDRAPDPALMEPTRLERAQDVIWRVRNRRQIQLQEQKDQSSV